MFGLKYVSSIAVIDSQIGRTAESPNPFEIWQMLRGEILLKIINNVGYLIDISISLDAYETFGVIV